MMKNTATSLLDFIDQRLADESAVLPPFDRTALQVQRALAEPETDAEAIEKLIIADQALTGQVLRTANSAFYRGLAEVSTVRAAIVRLGLTEIANIVVMVTQRPKFQARSRWARPLVSELWRHSVGAALGSQWLARRCGYGQQAHEAFTGGLLHDIGRLLLLSVIDTLISERRIRSDMPAHLLSEIVDRLHGSYGERLLRQWNLPEIYCQIAREHDTPDGEPFDGLVAVVRLANTACRKLGIGVAADPTIMLAALPEAGRLGASEIMMAELEIKLEDTAILAA